MNNLYWCSFAGIGHIVTGEDETVGVIITFAPNPQAALDHALTFVPPNYREVACVVLQRPLEDIAMFAEDQMDRLITDEAELAALGASKHSAQDIMDAMRRTD